MSKKKKAPKAEAATGAQDTAEAPKKPLPAQRLSANTIWCGLCGVSFRRGANPGDPCPACGTPAILPDATVEEAAESEDGGESAPETEE